MRLFESNGYQLQYWIDEAAGDVEARPWLVLINSIATDLRIWDPVVASLRGHYRILRYDARGQGGSTVEDTEFSIASLADDLIALLDGLGIRTAHLCGLSLGGMVAMHLATIRPERVKRLILCNTAAYVGPPESWNARAAAVREAGMEAVRPAVLDRWLSAGYVHANPIDTSRVLEMALQSQPAGYIAACAAIRDMDQRESIRAIQAPTLVIGGALDLATTPADTRHLADVIPGSRYVELPCGHLSHIEMPERLAAEFSRFLGGDTNHM